jgi:hypothetical protein
LGHGLLGTRFWRKVEKGEDCWEWVGFRGPLGYGRTTIKKRLFLAHRVAWALSFGPIPPGLWVLHHCDNPPCVRPEHLFLGTQQDNVEDMWAKGRQKDVFMVPRGSSHSFAKLSDEQVIVIKHRAESSRTLALEFGVGHKTILKIKSGVSWRHLASDAAAFPVAPSA